MSYWQVFLRSFFGSYFSVFRVSISGTAYILIIFGQCIFKLLIVNPDFCIFIWDRQFFSCSEVGFSLVAMGLVFAAGAWGSLHWV